MKVLLRILAAIMLGVSVYLLSVFVIPSLSLFEELLKADWISKGTIAQVSYLVFSLLLIFILGNGKFSEYGFRGLPMYEMVRPILVAVPAGFLVIILNVFTIILAGPDFEAGENTAMGSSSFLKVVITIWLIASTCEEIFFRGFLIGYLSPVKNIGIRLFRIWLSVPVIVSAIGFGLGHLCLLGSMNDRIVVNIVIATTILGFIAGYYWEKTGSILPSIAVHMTFNIIGYTIPMLMMKAAGGA